MNEKIILPEDIQKHVRKNVLKCVIPFSFLEIAFTIILIFFGNTLFPTKVKGFQILCYFLVLIAPFFITGFPFKIMDRAWCGEIIGVQYKSRLTAYGGARLRARTEQVVIIKVKTADGEILQKEAMVCEQKPFHPEIADGDVVTRKMENYVSEYQVGDTVYHVYGLKQLLVIRKDKQNFVRCLVCSQSNTNDRDTCWDCGHTLVKDAPLRQKFIDGE